MPPSSIHIQQPHSKHAKKNQKPETLNLKPIPFSRRYILHHLNPLSPFKMAIAVIE
jgi:hypothetical protein